MLKKDKTTGQELPQADRKPPAGGRASAPHAVSTGARRRIEEAARMARIKAAAAVPSSVGPDVAPAPARGPFKVVTPMGQRQDANGDWQARPSGYLERNRIERADVFDVMEAAARRAKLPPPFTEAQKQMARHYAALVERHAGSGVKLSSFDATGGGGGATDRMAAVIRDGEEIAALRRRIGDGVSLAVRRVRPSTRGSRRAITDRVLVDMLCLHGRTIGQVLELHGWSVKGRTRKAARIALANALDRMIWGPSPVRPQNGG